MIIKTMCPRDCPDACYLDVTVVNGTITQVRGSKENPVTAGITCPRALGDPDRVYSMTRVLNPYIKKPDEPGFNLVTWDQALDKVTTRLSQTIEAHGSESVLLLDFAGNTGILTDTYPHRLWNHLGVTKTDYTICSSSGHAALNLHYGLSYGIQPEELLEKKTIVFWGNNAKVSTPHQWALALKARRENDANIIVVDPRQSPSADSADLWLYPRPGTDVALCYGLARYLIEQDYIDTEFIEEWTYGYDSYKEEALKWTPERVEEVTGMKWEGVVELGEVLANGGPCVILMGIGLQKSIMGAENVRAVSLIPALLGVHRGFYYTNSRGRYLGGDLSGAKRAGKDHKVVSMITLGKQLARGDFKFVYIYNMNPVLTLSDSKNVLEGFNRSDVFVVVHDTHFNETCDIADVVLPAPTFLEKDDITFSDSHSYVRKITRVVEPEGNSRPETWLMWELAKRLDIKNEWIYANPWKEAEAMFTDALERGTYQDLLNGHEVILRRMPKAHYQTPTGRIEFFATKTPEGVNPLPFQLEVSTNEDELVLLNSAVPKYLHTQFRDVYGEISRDIWINPHDAERNGVEDGDDVVVFNEHGEIKLTAVVTRKVSRGVLWCSRQLIDPDGNIQNSLVVEDPQLLGGGPTFNSTLVRIR